MSYWARNGGGDIWVLLCSQRGGGGGGDTKKIFRKGDSFWRFPPLLTKRQKLSIFRKNFSCPPPPVANTVTPKFPPPPFACTVRHLTTLFALFSFWSTCYLVSRIIGQILHYRCLKKAQTNIF